MLEREKNPLEFYLSMKHQGNRQMTTQNITTVERKALESINTQFQIFHSLPKSYSTKNIAKGISTTY